MGRVISDDAGMRNLAKRSWFGQAWLQRNLAPVLRSRLGRFLAALIFLAIFVVELVILIPSYTGFRQDLLNRLGYAGFAAVHTLLHVAPALHGDMSANQVPNAAETALILNTAALRSPAIGGATLRGGRLYGRTGQQASTFGIVPTLTLRDDVDARLTDDGRYYDVVWAADADDLPFIVIARLDASHISGELTAFVFRVLGLAGIISLVVCGITLLIVGHYVIAPVVALNTELKTAGAAPEEAARQQLRPLRDDELGDLVLAFNQATAHIADMLGALRDSRAELSAANEQLEHKVAARTYALTAANDALLDEMEQRERVTAKANHLANHDPLTDLGNRRLFGDLLLREMNMAWRQNVAIAVILLDLDNFKEINDRLGHEVGDALLRQTADRLRAGVREHDPVARLGGDEFGIIQTGLDDADQSANQARRLLQELGEPYEIDGQRIQAPASIGIAIYPSDGSDRETLLKNAELAMYRAKQNRGTIAYFDRGLDESVRRGRALEQEIRAALAAGQYRLHYQPKHFFAGGAVAGAEALIRWEHPERGFVSPGDFIPIAERTGLIKGIGEWALFEAARQFRDFAAAGLPTVPVAVNLSAVQLRDGSIPDLVRRVLVDTGLPPAQLELEITESVMMDDIKQTVEVLETVHALGVGLSIDDFGTGYSSLSYLRQLPVDKMKVDRTFVCDIDTSADAATIARMIVGLGQALNLEIVAEGIETEAQYNYLYEIGCTEAQGYLLSKPLPADRFEAYLRQDQAADRAPGRRGTAELAG